MSPESVLEVFAAFAGGETHLGRCSTDSVEDVLSDFSRLDPLGEKERLVEPSLEEPGPVNGDGQDSIKKGSVLECLGNFFSHQGSEREVSLEFEASHEDTTESLVVDGRPKPIQANHPRAVGAFPFRADAAPGACTHRERLEKGMAILA
ncbi:MAG: hypothetical protein QXI19_03375 [Candidatus Caldarchaeum sp.]